MGLEEYQKEEALQQALLVKQIDKCNTGSGAACQALAEQAAELAQKRFMATRFGAFAGEQACIIYANMGPDNLWIRDRFRQRLRERGIRELSVFTWPVTGKDANSTWAVFIESASPGTWVQVARDIFVGGE